MAHSVGLPLSTFSVVLHTDFQNFVLKGQKRLTGGSPLLHL